MPDFTTDSKPETKAETEELDIQEEILIQMEHQTKLLKSINSKIGFFVLIAILYIIISILGGILR